jgi:hypothetical protein
MRARELLLSLPDVQDALGPRALFTSSEDANPGPLAGELVKSAAVDSAFRRFSGRLDVDGRTSPVTSGVLVLVFDSPQRAQRTFSQVGQAAHLRTEVEGSNVAVETVTAKSGLVSYWGFVQREDIIAILTLDTVDPHEMSVADLRSLVISVARRLEAALANR